MGRRALVVGINHYDHLGPGAQLTGAIPDAQRVANLIARHGDKSPNYACLTLLSDPNRPVTRDRLREALEQLFRPTGDEVLFYFSGHGTVTSTGGLIVTQDARGTDAGISMDDILTLANRAGEREAVIILDCCMSGNMGNPGALNSNGPFQQSILSPNVTILAASAPDEPAVEVGGQGLFTSLLVDALEGTAGDVLGNVTLPSIYAHIEGSLGPWSQRPYYKTYTTSVGIVRKAKPHIDPGTLRCLNTHFPAPGALYGLTPEHEYDESPQTPEQRACQLFKRLRDVGLVESETGADFYWAAMRSENLRLTQLGRHYWHLIDEGRI